MKILYLLVAVMFVGLILMFISAQKMLAEMQEAKAQGQGNQASGIEPTSQARIQAWLASGYLGFALFAIGGAGGIIVAFRMMRGGF